MTPFRTTVTLAALAALALAGCNSSSSSSSSNSGGDNGTTNGTGTTGSGSTSGSTGGSTSGGTTASGNGPTSPSAITITAANKSEIDLSWVATTTTGQTITYTLQRQAAGGTFTTLATGLTGTTWSDFASDGGMDAFTDYSYQVQAVDSQGTSAYVGTSHPAGPPPAGFGLAVGVPNATVAANNFGTDLSWASDSNGDAAIAYAMRDPNNDSDDSDDEVDFVSWNRKDFVCNAPVKVATAGAMSNFGRETALARDAAGGTYVLAFGGTVGANKVINVSTSSDGTSWSALGSVGVGGVDLDQPALAVNNGTAYLAFFQADANGSGVHYRTGAITAQPSSWTDTPAPLLANTNEGPETPLDLALDSTGTPALAYWLNDADSTNSLALLRPGSASPNKITDTNGMTNGPLDVALTFDGTQPRVAMIAYRVDPPNPGVDTTQYLWFDQSVDGSTWQSPVAIPNDQHDDMVAVISIAIGAQHQGAIAAEKNQGTGDNLCGNPKLSTSSDLVQWSTCSPDADNTKDAIPGGSMYPLVRFGGHDKMDMAFNNVGSGGGDGTLNQGVYYWHQP